MWNPTTCSCENGKYLASVIDDSAITCDEVIESYEKDAEAKLYNKTNFNEKKAIGFINYYSIIDSCLLKH